MKNFKSSHPTRGIRRAEPGAHPTRGIRRAETGAGDRQKACTLVRAFCRRKGAMQMCRSPRKSGGQPDDGLSAERQCGGTACVDAEQEGGVPSGVEAYAQAAGICRNGCLYQRRGGRNLQGRHVSACRPVCDG